MLARGSSQVCNNAGMLSAFMISASVAEVVGLLIFPKATKALSRKKTFLFACALLPIGLILLLVVGFVCPTNILLTAIAGIIVKTGTGLELGCAIVFLADVVDYGEYVLGERNEGVVFSLQTLIVKINSCLHFTRNWFRTRTYSLYSKCSAVTCYTELNSCINVCCTNYWCYLSLYRI
uniref:MFS transporter n=1 Tax=Catenibacterium mitsuokai TaxID=100886 RepID=UPI003D77EFA4